jgi:tetratricopeptide (TPR) repeat protein
MIDRSTTRPAWLALLALAAACGGPEPAASAQAAPLLATLAQAGGPGTAELRAGDLAAARAGFEAALRADPDRMAALNDLAVGYHLAGRAEAARQLLDEVVARGAPREQQAALVNLGELYALEGYLPAAQAYLESASEIDAGRAEPVFALALLADARGDPDPMPLVAQALRLDPDGSARRALVFAHPEERWHLEALVAEATGDEATAAQRWRELRAGRFPSLALAARRHLGEP